MKKIKSYKIINYINYYLNKLGKIELFVLFLLIFTGALFEIVGIGLFVPLLNNNVEIEALNSFFTLLGVQKDLISIVILIFCIFILKFIFLLYQNKKMFYMINNLLYKIRNDLYNGIFKMKYMESKKIDTSYMSNIIIKESERVSLGIKYLSEVVVGILYAIAYLLFIFTLSKAIFILSICVGIIFLFLITTLTKKIKTISYSITKWSEKLNQYILDTLYNVKYLKATNEYKQITKHFDYVNGEFAKSSTDSSIKVVLSRLITEPIGVSIVLILLLINNFYNFTSMQEVIIIAFLFYKSFSQISGANQKWQNFIAVNGSIDTVVNFTKHIDINAEILTSNNKLDKINSLSFNNIHYSVESTLILDNINVNLNSSFIAIIGESGSGKTTMLNLISSLYLNKDYNINGISSIKQDINSFRDKLGYISQESVIFDDTLYNNLTLWQEYQLNEIEEVLKIVNLYDFYKKNGLNYSLGSGGINLSGGERQRVAIAREILKKPQLLIMDEATSALDINTEREIWNDVKKLSKNIQIIVVTHKLDMLKLVDQVIMLEKSKLVFNGSYQELILNKKYRSFNVTKK